MAIQEGGMSVLVSDEILQAAKMSDADLKRELAVLLYQQKKLGLSKARELAEMPLIKFQQELARRQIPVFDDVAGFEVEVDQLKALGDL
jgi:predicted HTH domain antitoxin